jgi:glucan-binding YG repeat protein
MYTDKTTYIGANDYGLDKGYYTFQVDGTMYIPDLVNGKKAIISEGNKLYFTIDGVVMRNGLNELDGEYYYSKPDGALVVDAMYWVNQKNDLIGEPNGYYNFDSEGKLIKTGFVHGADGYTFYYIDCVRARGLVKIGDDYYYFNPNGLMYTDKTTWVSANNPYGLKGANYYFDKEGKMVTE